jgi:hypothetical protein
VQYSSSFTAGTTKKIWVAKLGKWVATLVARLLFGFKFRHLSKIQNGRQKERSSQHSPPKKVVYLLDPKRQQYNISQAKVVLS